MGALFAALVTTSVFLVRCCKSGDVSDSGDELLLALSSDDSVAVATTLCARPWVALADEEVIGKVRLAVWKMLEHSQDMTVLRAAVSVAVFDNKEGSLGILDTPAGVTVVKEAVRRYNAHGTGTVFTLIELPDGTYSMSVSTGRG